MKLALAFLAALPLFADSGLDAPALGHFVDAHGVRRALLGVPGAFVIGTADQINLLGLACSAAFCVAQTETQLIAPGVTIEAAGPALVGVEGNRALIYLSAQRQFAFWRDGILERLDSTLTGDVVAVGLVQGSPEIAVRDGTSIRIVRPDGAVLGALDSQGPVEFLGDGVVYASAGEVVIRRDSGIEIRFPLDAIAFFRPSSEYLGVRARTSTFLIRLTEGREDAWQLPEREE